MCLYIVDNVSTCRIIYFRYVDTEKRNNLNAIFEYRVGPFWYPRLEFFGQDSNSRVSCSGSALVDCDGCSSPVITIYYFSRNPLFRHGIVGGTINVMNVNNKPEVSIFRQRMTAEFCTVTIYGK